MVTIVIPARLAASRLPRKVLAEIGGKPLLWYVWQRARQVQQANEIWVATDSQEVFDVVSDWGGQVLMTSPDCQSGTERIASIIHRLQGELIVNVQGDEPLIDPDMLDQLISRWLQAPCDLVTPVFPIRSLDDLRSHTVNKVVRAHDGRVLYFSRQPIPFVRDLPFERWLEAASFWGHIGVYGYRREVLENFDQLPASPLEQVEHLEQLRFLEAGYTFQTIETDYRSLAVDVPEDLVRVRKIMEGA